MSDSESEEFLGLTKLFNENRHVTVPSEVRQKLGILNEGNFKLLWLFDRNSERIYVKVSGPPLSKFSTKPWP